MNCTWKRVDGRYLCQAVQCIHWMDGGKCAIGKVTLTCDNNDCEWNDSIDNRVYVCRCMDVHLDADGRCLGLKPKS
jgi:hypothetical protein